MLKIEAKSGIIVGEVQRGGYIDGPGGLALPRDAAMSASHRTPPIVKVIEIGPHVNEPEFGETIEKGDHVVFDPFDSNPVSIRDPGDPQRVLIFLRREQIVATVSGKGIDK